jgi:BlaI family penicillinase repressor
MGRNETSPPRSLSDSEWEVMKVLWEYGPMAARDAYAHLSDAQSWAQGTVKTLLRRMVQKGWLSYTRVGNSFLYRAAVPRRKGLRSAIRQFSERVLGGALSPFVAYYAEEKRLTPEDVAELEKLLKLHQKGKGN